MRFSWLLVVPLVLAACDDSVVVQLMSGPQIFEVSTAELMLPPSFRDDSGGAPRIATVPCGPMGMCPSSAEVAITCEDGLCDPSPRTISAPVGDVVDFDVLSSEARSLVRHIDAIEVLSALYEVPLNTLTVDVPSAEIFWGPEGAVDVDPAMGVVQLGTVPAIPARSMDPGAVALDPAGVAALSDYLVRSSRRVRFFARTRVDLEPGGPFPEGTLRVSVNLTVRITGSVVR